MDEKLYYARLVSVDFGDSKYFDEVSYTVTLEGYRGIKDFKADKKVLDPRNEYVWAEEEDATITLTHTISARGIITDDNETDALENATNFVNEYIAADHFDGSKQLPYIIALDQNPNFKRYLESENEEIDRLSCTYSLTRVYKASQCEDEYSILRYTSATQETIGDTKKITFQGTITLGAWQAPGGGGGNEDLSLTDNMKLLRERYDDFKDDLEDPDTEEELTQLLGETVDEDHMAGTLTFNLTYGDRKTECVKDYTIETVDTADSSLVQVSVNGTISASGPCAWQKVSGCMYGDEYEQMTWKDSATTLKKVQYLGEDDSWIFEAAKSGYDVFKDHNDEIKSDDSELNSFPLSFDITENPQDKNISFNFTYDDRISWGCHKVDYTMNFNLPVKKVAVSEYVELCDISCHSCSHHLQYLGVGNLGTFGMDMTVDGLPDHADFASKFGFADTKFLDNVKPRDEPEDGYHVVTTKFDQSDTENKITSATYEFIWSPEGPEKLVNTDADDYTVVNNLYFGK